MRRIAGSITRESLAPAVRQTALARLECMVFHPYEKKKVERMGHGVCRLVVVIPGLKIESSPQRLRPVAGDPETWSKRSLCVRDWFSQRPLARREDGAGAVEFAVLGE